MIETSRGKADSVEMALLLGGIAAVLVAYFLPAVTFAGQRGAAVYGLSIFSKLPIMSALAFAAMAAALATRVIPSLEKYAEQAAVIAILMALAPALLGFLMALDPWTGIRQTMLKMANTRTVKVDPSFAYIPLFAGATMMGFSLRRRMRRTAQGAVAAWRDKSAEGSAISWREGHRVLSVYPTSGRSALCPLPPSP